jgi:hypothetical protein
MTIIRSLRQAAGLLLAAISSSGCELLTDVPRTMRPQTVTLIATPKIIADFSDPEPSVAAFLDHYAPLTTRAEQTIVVFAVGNSEHILTYGGLGFWSDTVEWARYTNGEPVSDRVLDYRTLNTIVRAFKSRAEELGLQLKIFDQVDQGIEFTREYFKLNRHPECLDLAFEHSFDIRGRLKADTFTYASAPHGIPEGKLCGEFLADQVAQYMHDVDFDGIMYGNQLGTRGRWQPDKGPGYSLAEANAITDFLAYSKRAYGEKELIWFDSYNDIRVERDTYSVAREAYGHLDYLIAAGFCVITFPARYRDNLTSKLRLRDQTRVLATLDYVDPWYDYRSMVDFADESNNLEHLAVRYRYDIDGFVFFANDSDGELVPADRVSSFVDRFFPPGGG